MTNIDFAKTVRGIRLFSKIDKTMRSAEIVHSGHKDSLYAYEVDIDLEKGLFLSGVILKAIREWVSQLEVIKKEADGIANESAKLLEN